MLNKEIGKRIKYYRQKENLTQQALATKIGKTESSIRKYENGTTEAPLSVLENIAQALNIPLEKLLEGYFIFRFEDPSHTSDITLQKLSQDPPIFEKVKSTLYQESMLLENISKKIEDKDLETLLQRELKKNDFVSEWSIMLQLLETLYGHVDVRYDEDKIVIQVSDNSTLFYLSVKKLKSIYKFLLNSLRNSIELFENPLEL